MSKDIKSVPKTEVSAEPRRRTFSKEYKLRILEKADECGPGEVGELLRSEGLYSSHLTSWRKQRREGSLKALGRRRGPKTKKSDEQRKVDKLLRENARLRRKLEHAEKIIGVQKKLSEVMGIQLQKGDGDATESD
jgi:transposase